jgi:dTDP-4-amino-4,6-dideoxygalactose transaminase
MKKIPMVDLLAQYKLIKKDIDLAIKSVITDTAFIGGAYLEKFEFEMANYCNTKYSIGLNSGTDALYLSLWALGISKGDEVITTPFTFFATAEVIARLGAKPVFVDINPDTFNIDENLIEKKITKKTKAIIPVHLFGLPVNMDKINKIAKKYNLYVVEDACQAIGSEYGNKKIGSLGDVGCFSFFPSKNLNAYGDGGMVVTDNKKIAEKTWF